MQISLGLFALALLGLAIPAAGSSEGAAGNPRVALETSRGRIVVELYPEKAPKTVENFLSYVKSGFYEGLEVSVDRDWLVIGRGRSADLVIAEPTISRAHAAIGYEATGFYLQDLGSTNGTMVNGARIDRQPLKPGDQIQMGRLVLGVTLP